METIRLLPAYGRTYNTVSATLADWNNGKDFKIMLGPYCSIRDIQRMKMVAECIELVCQEGAEFIMVKV